MRISQSLYIPTQEVYGLLLGKAVWRFKTLPFELNSACYVFTKLTKPIVAVLTKLGIRVILYLDDMLILWSTQEGARKDLAAALELLVAPFYSSFPGSPKPCPGEGSQRV